MLEFIKNDVHSILEKDGKDVFVARSPGRLDVMGGIADYTGSLVCEMPLDVAAAVAVQRREDRKLVLKTYNVDAAQAGAGGQTVEISLDDFYGTAGLLPIDSLQHVFTAENHWAAYVAGAFPVLAKHKKLTRRVTGANIVCYSNVPIGGGVSSSAALECAALNALTAAYHLILDPLETAVLAQKVENFIVGAPCGVMDQVTSMLGKKDQLLLLHCQPHELQGYVAVPKGLAFYGINSNVKHSVGGSAYRTTRVSAFMAHAMIARMYKDFGIKKDPTGGYLANVSTDLYTRYFRNMLPETISGKAFVEGFGGTVDRVTTIDPAVVYYPRAAAEHHVWENARVQEFVKLLERAGTDGSAAVSAGALMLESHRSYSENAKMGATETDVLVQLLMARGVEQGIFGAKITGGGSGGTVAVLAQSKPETLVILREVCEEYEKRTGLQPKLLVASSPGGAEWGAVKLGVELR